jgi:GDP-L-fucose synthase
MKSLVTGATGFLGKHLIERLIKLGHEVSISNTKIGNLSNLENLKIYNEIKFDYIFHLAAKTKAGDYCLYHKGEQWLDNQIINTNILKYWCDHQPQAKMIAIGTSCSYSPEFSDNLVETNYLLGEPDYGLYTYAMTKRMLLIGLKSLSEQYGLEWVYLIPSTIYGPNFELGDTHFIFDLIKKISGGKYDGSNVELWGDGYQKRELVYVDDVVNSIISLKNLKNEIINIGTGNEYSIRDYAKIISDTLDFNDLLINYNVNRYVGVRSKKLSVNKLISNLPIDFKFTDLKDGMSNTINYYIKNKY